MIGGQGLAEESRVVVPGAQRKSSFRSRKTQLATHR
jgi:hypothetical protein